MLSAVFGPTFCKKSELLWAAIFSLIMSSMGKYKPELPFCQHFFSISRILRIFF